MKRGRVDPMTREAMARTPLSRPKPRVSMAHSSVVVEAQASVKHPIDAEAISTVGLTSLKPKFNPEIVTWKLPDVGELIIITRLRIGASKVNESSIVPTTEPTVAAKCRLWSEPQLFLVTCQIKVVVAAAAAAAAAAVVVATVAEVAAVAVWGGKGGDSNNSQ